jgi:hypothetical protein
VPTPFGVVVLVLMVVGTIAGLVIWGFQISSRSASRRARRSHPDAPVDENTAAAMNVRSADRNGLG